MFSNSILSIYILKILDIVKYIFESKTRVNF